MLKSMITMDKKGVRILRKSAQVFTKGFTLVELLVVIAIIAILAAVVVLIINPLELTRRGRDSARLTDLANLQQAINVAVQESTDSAQEILCKGVGAATCAEKSNVGTRNPNGTGWVKVDLSSQQAISVPTLPIDPNGNNVTYHYVYCADTSGGAAKWEIFTELESAQQLPKEGTDGGNDTAKYEIGSDLTLSGSVSGCAYL